MAQTATQRTTGSTRFKGPTIITLRGAGSKGHEDLFGGVAATGTGLDVGLSIQVPTGQTAYPWQVEQPDGTTLAAMDAAGGLLLSGALSTSQRVLQVTVPSASILSMYTAEILLLAAPAAGIGIVVSQVLMEMKCTATAYLSGGVVVVQYGNSAHAAGTAVHAGSLPASVVLGGAGNVLTAFYAASGSNGVTVPCDGTNANSGLYIGNATGLFTTGTGTMIVTISYDLVTLG
jgi:hypothetical protein